MSYILEALKKMELQRKKDSHGESWVEALSDDQEEEKPHKSRLSRLIMSVSIFFGVGGMLTGLFLYHRIGVQKNSSNPIIQPKVVAVKPQTAQNKSQSLDPKPASQPRVNAPLVATRRPSSEKATTLASVVTRAPSPKKDHQREAPDETEILQPPSPAAPPLSRNAKMIDLTNRYRLSSTGEIEDRKYATIERRDYQINDEFKGMIITDIGRDRVQLKAKENGQKFVIIFRYKK
ncbi:hypothetical protein ACFL9T_20705 [Thermodesulfobacteriota bacterium]